MTLKIAIVAGEPSGDILAGGLITSLRALHPDIEIEGVTGPEMSAAGCKSLFTIERLSVAGIVEVVKNLPGILRLRRDLIKHFKQNPPDLFIGVDAPDFNLPLEGKLKKMGVKTVHYSSPTVWAWRQGRVKKIRRSTDLMLTLYPFEEDFYKQHDVGAHYVGHRLADEIDVEPDQMAARQRLDLPLDKPILAILPGSRGMEIKYLAAVFLQAAQLCREQMVDLQFVIPAINQRRRAEIETVLAETTPGLPVKLVDGNARDVMMASDAVLLASGTATLEAMLLKKAMVVAYRVSGVTAWILRRMVKATQVSLPNLLAGKALVPEILQEEVTPRRLANEILARLQDPEASESLKQEFTKLHQQLRCNASEQAAKAVLALAAR